MEDISHLGCFGRLRRLMSVVCVPLHFVCVPLHFVCLLFAAVTENSKVAAHPQNGAAPTREKKTAHRPRRVRLIAKEIVSNSEPALPFTWRPVTVVPGRQALVFAV
jgi:hypothetical protein